MLRSCTVMLAALVVVASSARADSLSNLPPSDEYRLSVEAVRNVLAPFRTLSEMVGFAGTNPSRCIQVDRPSVICVWSLSKQQVGWRPLANALGTGDRLNLVCQFPADEGPRVLDACSAHAKRSNRTYYRKQNTGSTNGVRKSNRNSDDLQGTAQRQIDQARTAFALSTLVGDAPASCRFGETESVCSWPTDASTYGHGTLALSIRASYSKKVTLTCRLPVDGGPRAPDACSVSIGG
jgi:hypothetical protein